MKAQLISDLHLEFGLTGLSFEKADLIIFAGDVHVGTRGIKWILEQVKEKPVIYVLGNHEYYKGSYPKTLNKIREVAAHTHVHVLENDSVEIDGITFHGATLWTDFSLFGDPKYYGMICQGKMNDYRKIRRDPSYSKLRSIDVFNIHHESLRWLENSLSSSATSTNVIVTHHAPSVKSIPPQYKDDPLSAAYASNLEYLIEKYQPPYWIHGHIHTPMRYKMGETLVLCNPRGYANEPDNGYEAELIIEIT